MAIVCADQLTSAIALDGYAFVRASDMHELLAAKGPLADWRAFASSWNDLELDLYMADGGRYRRRRHAVYAAAAGGTIVRGPNQPHYQSRDYNALNGGIARWFAPVNDAIGSGETMTAILACSRAAFESLAGPRDWLIEVHQFRIAARIGEEGRPTPEGVHRDGVDYVLVLLIERHNVASGTTTAHRLDGRELGAFTLTTPLDAALLDDSKVAHGVTPIEPVDPSETAYRDVLVVTWKRKV
ncbi:MAG TPA: 2OG-Fe dioxygenase family protein [Gemmatimonadaceae bacterium]|nr:2OG-Fe dioxygenase family protein [Gemmatimonadaceae bacterium]